MKRKKGGIPESMMEMRVMNFPKDIVEAVWLYYRSVLRICVYFIRERMERFTNYIGTLKMIGGNVCSSNF